MGRGCGCQTGLLRLLPIPYGKVFYAACCIHDDDYDRGGDGDDRERADKLLFSNCLHIVAHGYSMKPRKCVWMMLVALMYYYSVRIMGRRYFNYR